MLKVAAIGTLALIVMMAPAAAKTSLCPDTCPTCFVGGQYSKTFLAFMEAQTKGDADDQAVQGFGIMDPQFCNGDKYPKLVNKPEWHCMCEGNEVYEKSKYRRTNSPSSVEAAEKEADKTREQRAARTDALIAQAERECRIFTKNSPYNEGYLSGTIVHDCCKRRMLGIDVAGTATTCAKYGF